VEPSIFKEKAHKNFRLEVRKFTEKEIQPNALNWEKKRYFPPNHLRKLGRKGYIGISLPKNVGGGGKDFWHEVILAEELARSKTLGWPLTFMIQGNMTIPLIDKLGTKKQKNQILKPAIKGDYYLAFAATEPGSGSDMASISTTAVLDKKSYILNGEKRYITNGSIARYIVVLARSKDRKDVWSQGMFIVDRKTSGLRQKRLMTSGLKTGDTGSITFKNCVIPKENVLGDSAMAFIYLLKELNRERLVGAVALNSIALQAWEETLEFLKNRKRFGESLSKKQVIRHKMADLRTRIEASRQFTYAVCGAFAKGEPVDKEILMLKILSYENCQKVIDECAHLYGGDGFLTNHWLSHARQDAQAFTIAAGTSEIMRDLLAGMLKM